MLFIQSFTKGYVGENSEMKEKDTNSFIDKQ